MRKPQSNSKLKTLHPKRQRELWDFLQNHKQSEAVEFVKEKFEISTSPRALSKFYSWYPFCNQLKEYKDLTVQVTAALKADPELHLSSEKVSKAAHVIFESLAAKTLDSKLFIELRKLRQADRDQTTKLRRLEILGQSSKS